MYWDDVATGYIDYTYDATGNLISEMLYDQPSSGDAVLITSTQYEFDSNPNPYNLLHKLMLPGIYTNPNNITKETYTIYLSGDQGTNNVQVTTNTYTYNAKGYPVTKNGNVTFVYM